MMMIRIVILCVTLGLSFIPAQAQVGKVLKSLGLDKQEKLSDGKVVSGLKEALEVGTKNTVEQTGQLDGYFANEAIKILMPEKLQKFDRVLRMAGFDEQLDEFVLSMNRAAEKAAPFAKDIFWTAITEMTFEDARGILQGGDTAATEFFERTTRDRLAEAFHPTVSETMEDVGVTRQFKALTGQFERIPFVGGTQSFDIDEYVVGKALDGLFHVLGEEEKKIRTNPAARVTDLLKTVFGQN